MQHGNQGMQHGSRANQQRRVPITDKQRDKIPVGWDEPSVESDQYGGGYTWGEKKGECGGSGNNEKRCVRESTFYPTAGSVVRKRTSE